MKIKTKLLLGLSTLPILIVLMIGIGYNQMNNLNKMSTKLQTNYELANLADQIHKGVKDEAISLRNIALFTDHIVVEEELAILQRENDFVVESLILLESKVNEPEKISAVTALKNTNDKFDTYKDNVIDLIAEGKREEAIQLINNEGRLIHTEFFDRTAAITDLYGENMTSSLQNISEDLGKNILIGSFVTIVGFIIVFGFVLQNVWTLARRLNKVSSVMKNVADGSTELGTKVEVKSNDEIGDVVQSFNTMAQSLEEQINKEQSLLWIKSNIAEITTDLNGTHDLEPLAQNFLSKVAPLLEASHAVFYIKSDGESKSEPLFKLLASYAFKERKHLSNTFAVGEGLVGQAALEKTSIILTDVPSDYIRIKSGLGEAPPLNVYVLPVVFEDDVKAVVEIASFKSFSIDQQNLLEELVNSLGIILDSVMGRIRLAKLLEESQTLMEEIQAQSEELQSQQEELRITNEELEEQTQALRQSEEKLQAQQEELEQANSELIEKAESLEEQNKRFEQTNREVEKARAELEEKAKQLALSSKYKSEFLANMSHELRTPLNSLLILSKLLSDNHGANLSSKQIEYAKTIHSSGRDLLIIINDILDLAKIESGKVEVNPQRVEIKELVEVVEQSFRPIANEKNLTFAIDVKEGIPASIYSDEQRIRQILKNLLSNAFKFTDKGGVTLEVDFSPYSNQHSLFSFAVKDTGIGIPKAKQKLVFEAFQQADGTTSRKYGGTGLGLSICREMANLLGGRVVVESEEGKGSTFRLFVGDYKEDYSENNLIKSFDEVAVTVAPPNEQQEKRPSEPTPTESQQHSYVDSKSEIKRLLIVDDDIRQRNSLMELIADKDIIPKAVSNGAEAIEALKVNQFDFMVLDLGLTDTTGFDLLEKVKTQVENENLKVFIYTGRDLTSKEEIYLNKYAHTIIIKDEHAPQRLKDELELYLNLENEMVYEYFDISPQRIPDLDGKRILLVDDDVRNVYALSSVLELYGMSITFAENGVEGLEILDENPNFDLVLMDIMMPEMDGYEAMQRIRANPEFQQLPIIALTAKAMKEDREKCMAVGASDYIVKPVDPDKLVSLMRVWLHQQEGK
ncbi:response regulator [Anaerobacillus sp. MEB173]|uniref:response regulator n=1 Tax=Anaerobacillus sp. MEB173 TaxID=3383345 RepID=UPI003F8FBF4D